MCSAAHRGQVTWGWGWVTVALKGVLEVLVVYMCLLVCVVVMSPNLTYTVIWVWFLPGTTRPTAEGIRNVRKSVSMSVRAVVRGLRVPWVRAYHWKSWRFGWVDVTFRLAGMAAPGSPDLVLLGRAVLFSCQERWTGRKTCAISPASAFRNAVALMGAFWMSSIIVGGAEKMPSIILEIDMGVSAVLRSTIEQQHAGSPVTDAGGYT